MRRIGVAGLVVLLACGSGDGDLPQVELQPVVEKPAEFSYLCESGLTISASYPDTDSALVRYRESTLRMGIAIAASGARYVSDSLEWWTKSSGPGSEALLLKHLPDGSSGEVLETCLWQ